MFGLDWLSFTLKHESRDALNYIQQRFFDVLGYDLKWEIRGGFMGYENSMRSEIGIVAWGGESQRGTMHISINGGGTSALGWYGCAQLLRGIIGLGVELKISRVDLAFDYRGNVWSNFAHVDKVRSRIKDGRVTNISIVQNYGRDDKGIWGLKGLTTYIGSRQSERFMRIYLKDIEGFRYTRFEYELKGRYAEMIGGFLLKGMTIREAFAFANMNHIRIDDLVSFSEEEKPCVNLPRKKARDSYKWLLRLSEFLYCFQRDYPELWNEVMVQGKRRVNFPPCSDTGVQIEEPDWLSDQIAIYMNLVAHGVPYDPLLHFCNEKLILF